MLPAGAVYPRRVLTSDDIMYVFSRGASATAEVCVSTDDGMTWMQSSPLTGFADIVTASEYGGSILVTGILSSGLSGSAYYTGDNGWTYGSFADNGTRRFCTILPNGILLVSRNSGGFIEKSRDGGSTWEQVEFTNHQVSWVSGMYTTSSGCALLISARFGVYVSDIDGENWTKLNTEIQTSDDTNTSTVFFDK